MKYVIILIEYDKNFKRFVKKYEKFLIIKATPHEDEAVEKFTKKW